MTHITFKVLITVYFAMFFAFAVRQSAEDDRSSVSTGQWSSVFCYQTVFVTLLWGLAFSGVTWKHTFYEILRRRT